MKNGTSTQRRKGAKAQSSPIRKDHEVVRFGNHLITILGTIGGTQRRDRGTARNIEAFLGRSI